jgi:hypothetical protein
VTPLGRNEATILEIRQPAILSLTGKMLQKFDFQFKFRDNLHESFSNGSNRFQSDFLSIAL